MILHRDRSILQKTEMIGKAQPVLPLRAKMKKSGINISNFIDDENHSTPCNNIENNFSYIRYLSDNNFDCSSCV